MMICALCEEQRVSYMNPASVFDSEAEASSLLRGIQRLVAECVIITDRIAKLILKLIPVGGPYSLPLDRTDWKFSDTNINILALGIRIRGDFRAILHGKEFKAHWLFSNLRFGECRHLSGIYYVNGQPCYLSGVKDKTGRSELQILFLIAAQRNHSRCTGRDGRLRRCSRGSRAAASTLKTLMSEYRSAWPIYSPSS